MGTKPEAIKYESLYQVNGNHQALTFIIRAQLGTKLTPDFAIDSTYPASQQVEFPFRITPITEPVDTAMRAKLLGGFLIGAANDLE